MEFILEKDARKAGKQRPVSALIFEADEGSVIEYSHFNRSFLIFQHNRIHVINPGGAKFTINPYDEGILKCLHTYQRYLVASPLRIDRNIVLPLQAYDATGHLVSKFDLYLRGQRYGPVILFELAGSTILLKQKNDSLIMVNLNSQEYYESEDFQIPRYFEFYPELNVLLCYQTDRIEFWSM